MVEFCWSSLKFHSENMPIGIFSVVRLIGLSIINVNKINFDSDDNKLIEPRPHLADLSWRSDVSGISLSL
jgi:hypothetical protein